VPYFQLAGAYDIRFVDKKERFKPWAAGLIFNYDRAGDAKLSFTQLALSTSYSARLFPGKKHFLTFGLMTGGIQRAFKASDLQFDDQYTLKEGYLSTNPTAEAFDQTSKILGDVSVGMNLRLRKGETRATLDAGVAVFHLFEPKKNFTDEENPAHLETRYSLYAMGNLPVSDRFDLMLPITGQFQDSYQEGVLGAVGAYHFSTKRTQELDLLLGLYYRLGDAIIPTAGISYQGWQVQLSYDINTSSLKEASLNRGGPEISLIYILRHVPLMGFCKNCPVYM
jgi:type IX secretion system PorP/SprF family membrane protein